MCSCMCTHSAPFKCYIGMTCTLYLFSQGDDRNMLRVFVAGREIMLPSTETPTGTPTNIPTICNSDPPTSQLSLMMGVVLLAAAKLLI